MDILALSDLCTPWCLHVAVTFRFAEHIGEGHNRIDRLAAAAGVDAGAAARVLRQLITKGLFEEPEPGSFALNDAARQLLEPGLRIALDLNDFGGRMARAWTTLPEAVRTGRAAYHQEFGLPYWDDLEAHPKIARAFDELMSFAGHGVPDADVLVDRGDWREVQWVVDVGGGTGALLAEVLKAHPHLKGTLVDMPRVVPRATQIFEEAGVANRVEIAAQSFFDPLPAGAGVYLLKSVLCDWPDADAVRILSRCAEAARPSGRVVVVNGITDDPVADPNLLMLVLVGGADRTIEDFAVIAKQAGLRIGATRRRSGSNLLVECRPTRA